MKDTAAARKYAQALFAEASAKKEVLACQQGLEEIGRVARLRDSLRRVLTHPFIDADEKKKMIHSALGDYATILLERFLYMLVQKKRIDLLPVIIEEFQEEVDRDQNVQPLRVKAAFPLSEARRKQLQVQIESWLGSKVRMDVQVDPQLIGGLVIQTRDQLMDQSLRGKLQQMHAQLLTS